jgi:sulfatase maturation enzyme AslB (radical SAM superfamily)
MAYNPFRWYTNGNYRKKPLKSNAPLLLRIKNGDFDYSPFFLEAVDNQKLYDDMYNQYMETSTISNINDRKVEAHQYAKMKRIKAQKLMEKGVDEENVRLKQLRSELYKEFGEDLWEEAMESKLGGKVNTEDLYHWYKKRLGVKQSPSEMAIALQRETTKGLNLTKTK